jgi:cell division protein ZapA
LERLVRFELIGIEFAFYTGAPEEEVEEIIALVTDLVEENSSPGSKGSVAVGKVAVLASLNVASKYVELKRDFKAYKQETEERLSSLGKQIGEELAEEKRTTGR